MISSRHDTVVGARFQPIVASWSLLIRKWDWRNARPHPGPTAIELSPAAGPHWQALNLNPNRNLARLRFLEIKSKITIQIGKKPFRLNSMAVPPRRGRG